MYRFLVSFLIIIFGYLTQALPSFAANKLSYDQFRDLLLQANVEEIINRVNNSKSKIESLSSESLYLYLISLVVAGDMETISNNLKFAYKRGNKRDIDEINKHLKFYTQDFNFNGLALNDSEINTIALLKEVEDYLIKYNEFKNVMGLKEALLDSSKLSQGMLSSREKVFALIERLSSPVPYAPTQIDFLLELKDLEANKLANQKALKLIENKKQILFQNSMDFYELASAYKALAVNSIYNGNSSEAKRYIQLAREYIYKMRSIWVIEDFIIKRPILKIDKRATKFGFLFPQWLMLLREEYDNFLIS